jgi:hypothetical protein
MEKEEQNIGAEKNEYEMMKKREGCRRGRKRDINVKRKKDE